MEETHYNSPLSKYKNGQPPSGNVSSRPRDPDPKTAYFYMFMFVQIVLLHAKRHAIVGLFQNTFFSPASPGQHFQPPSRSRSPKQCILCFRCFSFVFCFMERDALQRATSKKDKFFPSLRDAKSPADLEIQMPKHCIYRFMLVSLRLLFHGRGHTLACRFQITVFFLTGKCCRASLSMQKQILIKDEKLFQDLDLEVRWKFCSEEVGEKCIF